MHRKTVIAIVAVLISFPAAAQGNKPPSGSGQEKLSGDDKNFLDFAAEDNQAEIQLCLLAEKSAQAPALKAFARLMVNDHVGIESRLAALINSEKVEVPNGVGKEGQETFSKLVKLKGEEFDREFIRAQIEDHGHDLERFGKERSSTTNEGIKQFASQTIPILEQHQKLAQAVQAAMTQGAAK